MLLPSCIGGKHIYKYKLECYVKKITGFHLLSWGLGGWGCGERRVVSQRHFPYETAFELKPKRWTSGSQLDEGV